MITLGVIGKKEPVKTTLLMAMNFGTNPNIISGIGTHVDMSGRGHVFQQYGYLGGLGGDIQNLHLFSIDN